MSKILNAPVGELYEKKSPRDIYLDTSNRVRQGVSENIWDNGSLEQKRGFVQDVLSMRIAGEELHRATGNAFDIPDIVENEGKLSFSMGKSSLSNFALQKNIEKDLEESKRSRYEMAADRFGDLGVSIDTDNEFSV